MIVLKSNKETIMSIAHKWLIRDSSLSSLDSEPTLSCLEPEPILRDFARLLLLSAHDLSALLSPSVKIWYPAQVPRQDWGCHSYSFWECCQVRTLTQSFPVIALKQREPPCPRSYSVSRYSLNPMMAELLEAEAFIETKN